MRELFKRTNAVAAIDAFVISIIINVTGQLKIVQKALRTIDDHLDDVPERQRDFAKQTKLVKAVNEIQRLLRFLTQKIKSETTEDCNF